MTKIKAIIPLFFDTLSLPVRWVLKLDPVPQAQLGQIHSEAFEIGKRAITQSTFVRGPQDHARRLSRLKGFSATR